MMTESDRTLSQYKGDRARQKINSCNAITYSKVIMLNAPESEQT